MLEWIFNHDWPRLVKELGLDGRTVDIGAGEGVFSGNWQSSAPSREHTGIDLWRPQPTADWPHCDNHRDPSDWRRVREKCEAIAARFQTFRLIEADGIAAAEQFEDGSIDALWLDANHNYVFVRDALKAWWPKIKPGGILGGAAYINRFHRTEEDRFMWYRSEEAVGNFAASERLFVYTNQEDWSGYFLSKPHRSPSITVVSGSTSGGPWLDIVRENHEEFCAAQGHSYLWMDFDDLERHPVWGKIFAVAALVEQAESDWIVWIDSDAVFMDQDKSLAGFLIEGTDAILPEWIGDDGRRRPSSGIMFWRANDRAREILLQIWKQPDGHFGYLGEEDAMRDVFYALPELCSRCLVVDHRHFNSMFPAGIGWNDRRDFIAHIGHIANADERVGLLKDLICNERDTRPKDEQLISYPNE